MPSEPAEPVQVAFTQEFKRNLRALAKKYRHTRSNARGNLRLLISSGTVSTGTAHRHGGGGLSGWGNGEARVE